MKKCNLIFYLVCVGLFTQDLWGMMASRVVIPFFRAACQFDESYRLNQELNRLRLELNNCQRALELTEQAFNHYDCDKTDTSSSHRCNQLLNRKIKFQKRIKLAKERYAILEGYIAHKSLRNAGDDRCSCLDVLHQQAEGYNPSLPHHRKVTDDVLRG